MNFAKNMEVVFIVATLVLCGWTYQADSERHVDVYEKTSQTQVSTERA